MCFFDYFYPAFKSGGPARSSLGLVEGLSNEFDLKVITRDRDKQDKSSFANITVNSWSNFRGKAAVCYLSPTHRLRQMIKAIRTVGADLYYFNSFYSPAFTILPLMLIATGVLPKKAVIIAPRGEFSPNAVKISAKRKAIYRWFYKIVAPEVKFHATAKHEEDDIKRYFNEVPVVYAPNLRAHDEFDGIQYNVCSKTSNRLNLVFLSRISPMKNLDFALRALALCKAEIRFAIYGPVDDQPYWIACKKLIEALPDNIKAEYKGTVKQNQVIGILQQYDILFLPTRGENYGHIVLESLVASRPVLLSENTPWHHLNKRQAGWSYDLASPGDFVKILEELTLMDGSEFAHFARNAYDYGRYVIGNQEQSKGLYIRLFA